MGVHYIVYNKKIEIVFIYIWRRVNKYHLSCLSNLLLENRHQLKSKNKKFMYQQGIIYQNLMNTLYFFYKNTKILTQISDILTSIVPA